MTRLKHRHPTLYEQKTAGVKAAIDDLIEVLGLKSLPDIARMGHEFGIDITRQSLHNWYTGKHLPARNTLLMYLSVLETNGHEGSRLWSMFYQIKAAVFGHDN